PLLVADILNMERSANPRTAAQRIDGIFTELRRSQRSGILTPAMLRQLDLDQATITPVMVTDVSLHGVGFRSPHALPIDDTLFYAIEIGVGPLHLTSRLRVVWSRRRRDGTYNIGGEFC